MKQKPSPSPSPPSSSFSFTQILYLLFLGIALFIGLQFYQPQLPASLRFPPPSPYHKYLSTKNTYHYTNENNFTKPAQSCEPVHFGLVSRHGTRYPSPKVAKKMNQVLTFLGALKKRTPLHPVWSQKRLQIPFVFNEKMANVLTERGKREMYLLGWRWYERMPKLFGGVEKHLQNTSLPFDVEGIFSISATQTFRTWQSARCFHRGLTDRNKGLSPEEEKLNDFFQNELTEDKYLADLSVSIPTVQSPSSSSSSSSSASVYIRPSNSDYALRFFDHCDKYLAEVRGEGAEERKKHTEQKTFEAPPEDSHGKKVLTLSKKVSKAFKATFFSQITSRFNQRWSLPKYLSSDEKMEAGFEDYLSPDWLLSDDFVGDLWTFCTNELAHADISHNWCSEFTTEDGVIFDFQSDIKNYYEKSYGQNISFHIAAPLLQEIYSQLQSSASGDSHSVHLRFAHAETVLPLLSILGLYKDDYELNEELNLEQMASRKFRSSSISPMGANVAFVLFNCPSSSASAGSKTKQVVKIYVNEKEEPIPGCDDECELHEFASVYDFHLTSSLNTICSI